MSQGEWDEVAEINYQDVRASTPDSSIAMARSRYDTENGTEDPSLDQLSSRCLSSSARSRSNSAFVSR